jgi:Putative auto-transporter adhesin, head GIN domain
MNMLFKQLFFAYLFSFFTPEAFAQNTADLSKEKVFDFKDFDKVSVSGINADVSIELGKAFSVSVVSNKPLSKNLVVKKIKNDELVLEKGEGYNWRDNISYIVKITMPEISKLKNDGNGNLTVNSFVGRYFGIKNSGNGDITVAGSIVDELDIECYGNGNINTKSLVAKEVKVTKTGNGDVTIKTDKQFNIHASGNGDIINTGAGKAVIDSKSGNGEIIYRN